MGESSYAYVKVRTDPVGDSPTITHHARDRASIILMQGIGRSAAYSYAGKLEGSDGPPLGLAETIS